MFGGGLVAAGFERLLPCGDEAERIQLELFGRHLSDDEMPVMHGIEGPSEEADQGFAQAPVDVGQTSPAPCALGWNRRM